MVFERWGWSKASNKSSRYLWPDAAECCYADPLYCLIEFFQHEISDFDCIVPLKLFFFFFVQFVFGLEVLVI